LRQLMRRVQESQPNNVINFFSIFLKARHASLFLWIFFVI
jgi:hypothetical protein